MLSSADDKVAEASKRQDIFFLYFMSALDYFHLYNLEHIYSIFLGGKYWLSVSKFNH